MAPVWASLGSLPWRRTLLRVPALTQGKRRGSGRSKTLWAICIYSEESEQQAEPQDVVLGHHPGSELPDHRAIPQSLQP